MVLKTVRGLPDDCSIYEIADRIEFLAVVQKGSRSVGPRRRHSPRRDQETVGLMAYKLIWTETLTEPSAVAPDARGNFRIR
jgi:hypothetical protein